ncbi:MAG: hypothetical protein KJ060_16370 [Candidatus Hydrogenedentes bacterium]|nr:hypothetical protein [Candidatus Hydrogenedentota bacterium]
MCPVKAIPLKLIVNAVCLVLVMGAVGCVIPVTTGDNANGNAGNPGPPPPPPPPGAVPMIAGAWSTNNSLTIDILQNGNTYTWTCRERPIPGHGTITGTNLDAYWTDMGQHLSAVGNIQVNAIGVATQINWNNGIVFTRI